MVAPIDWRGAFDTCRGEALARTSKIVRFHFERMMTPAKRMSDYRLTRGGVERRPRHLEQRKVLTAAIEQNLVAETVDDLKAQHVGVEPFGTGEVRHFDTEMIQPLEFHRGHRIRLSTSVDYQEDAASVLLSRSGRFDAMMRSFSR
jgi:hypothetical protein